MKKLILTLLILLFSSSSFSQSGWFQQQSGTNNHLVDVLFINSQTGWVVGVNGTILKTINAGTNWMTQTSNTTRNLISIFFLDGNTGWICGGNIYTATYGIYVVLKTTNGGANWNVQLNGMSINPFYYLSSIFFINPSTGWAVGKGGYGFTSGEAMYKTTNGGTNWNHSDFLSSEKIFFTIDSTGWVLANYWTDVGIYKGYVLKTNNVGYNWTNNLIADSTSYLDIHFINSYTGYVIGVEHPWTDSDVILMKTTNEGTSWTKMYTGLQDHLWNLFFVNENTGWICRGKIKKTTNGGYNWIQQFDLSPNASNGIYFINDQTGWVVGSNGKILKTINGGVMNLSPISSEVPDRFSLFQNYPNPFNNQTTIEFDIKEKGKYRLVIYDCLGRKIKELFNENLNAGSYRVSLNGNELQSGVYFYRLSANGNVIDTKKMLLIK
jgi:photosystem II stability/assembly factor-like uncharacterized protein